MAGALGFAGRPGAFDGTAARGGTPVSRGGVPASSGDADTPGVCAEERGGSTDGRADVDVGVARGGTKGRAGVTRAVTGGVRGIPRGGCTGCTGCTDGAADRGAAVDAFAVGARGAGAAGGGAAGTDRATGASAPPATPGRVPVASDDCIAWNGAVGAS